MKRYAVQLQTIPKKGFFDNLLYQMGRLPKPAGNRFIKVDQKGTVCKVQRIKDNGSKGDISFMESTDLVYPIK